MTGVLIRDCVIDETPGSSVYIEEGVIARLSMGSELPLPRGCEVIEANGGTLLPGLIDSHCHPFEVGWLRRNVDLRGVTNVTGMRLRVQSGVLRSKPGEWVVGMGWDQEEFPGGKMPTRKDIDDITPANPVALSRVCGHIALLNARAIDALGFASRSGAEFERSPDGELTGIVKETALTEAFSSIPRTAERCASDLQSVEAEAAKLGLTTIHCIVSPEGFREELEALSGLAAAGSLSLRYRVYVPPESLEFLESKGVRSRLQGGRVRVNGVKIYTDGSLGARTAALRDPYADDPSNTGILRMSDEVLADAVERADSLGLQAIVHAIGDRAVEQAIGALSSVTGSGNPRRHRIEHAALLPRDLRGKMARHGIRATVQPLFVTSDTWAADRLGEDRVRELYPFRSMLGDGILASGSSDAPVESMSPILGVWAAMTRGGSVTEESLTLEDAVKIYTDNGASNGFDEEGLKEGGNANLTLLDSNITGMHPALFRKVGVLATIVDGNAIHSFGAG